jgi:hypothetical protein
MAFIEVKATDAKSGALFPSKAAMKRAIAADVKSVLFRSVPSLGGSFWGTADQVPAGTTLVVVGPDPETSRKWYGNVFFKNGALKVT